MWPKFRVVMELYSGAGKEAMVNYPTKQNSGQAVPSVIQDTTPMGQLVLPQPALALFVF